MSPFHATALRARQDLDRLNRPWAFVGGLAVSTRAHQRLTNDIDAAVAVADDADAERAVATMLSMGYQVEAQLERMASQRLMEGRRLHKPRVVCS